MRLGRERVRQAKRQSLAKEFENIEFQSGESVTDFSMRIGRLVAHLKSLGGKVDEQRTRCSAVCSPNTQQWTRCSTVCSPMCCASRQSILACPFTVSLSLFSL
jgi:hypothetical protein